MPWTLRITSAARARRRSNPDGGANLTYPALGLCGEEVADVVKRVQRDDRGRLTPERRAALSRELGDVLWYAAALATEAGLDLAEIAQANLAKLADRSHAGVLRGEGDER